LRSQPAGQRASQPASQSGPLSALLSKENALKINFQDFLNLWGKMFDKSRR